MIDIELFRNRIGMYVSRKFRSRNANIKSMKPTDSYWNKFKNILSRGLISTSFIVVGVYIVTILMVPGVDILTKKYSMIEADSDEDFSL